MRLGFDNKGKLPKEPNKKISKKELVEILIVCVALGIGLLINDYIKTQVKFDGRLERQEAGAGAASEILRLEYLNEAEDLKVDISDKGLSEDELESQFNQAIDEIEKSYLGKNESADRVMYDLSLRSSYCEGLIRANWKFDKYGLISGDGRLNEEEIPSEGAVVNIIVELSYEESTKLYSFSIVVIPLGLDTKEGQINAIKKAVANEDKNSRNKNALELPKEVENIPITWKRKMNYRGLQVIILGIVCVFGLLIGMRKDEEKRRKALIADKEADYPLIVSELSILLGAGMSFRKALERIASKYIDKKKTGIVKAGYEDLLVTYRKITDGTGEIAALEDLGQRSNSKEYRKLAMLLSQNIKKGSKDLLDSLEKEESYAFEMRKQKALRAGEEASTKLLIPMAGMLFIVIVILIVPAMMQINI